MDSDRTTTPSVTRRRLVQALVVGAGAVGTATAARATAAEPGERSLVVGGRGFRTVRLGAEAGRLPDATHLPAVTGELVLDDGAAGRFSSATVPGSGGRFVLHSFDLGDGVLLGMGTGPLGDGAFALVGGTGRYAGARGAYTSRQSPVDLGGDGTATFVFTLTGGES